VAVKLLRRSRPEPEPEVETAALDEEEADSPRAQAGYTEKKGRPTPKRSDTVGRRLPPGPPPKTRKEMIARQRRQRQDSVKQKILTGSDDSMILPRDRGPVRRLARDVVDSQHNYGGMFLLGALFLSIFGAGFSSAAGAQVVLLATYAMFLGLVVNSWFLGRKVLKRVRAKYPDDPVLKSRGKRGALTYYAATRAIFPRRWRNPRPQVKLGEPLT
jgi:hypothetical protein